jgi:TrmH family RNA methyltransferase
LKKDLKWVRSLQQKKFRSEYNCFVVEGRKGVEEGLKSSFVLLSAYTTDAEWAAAHDQAIVVSAREMEQMTGLSSPSSHLAVFQQHAFLPEWQAISSVLVLDGIADPGNMGTIIRTAEWFGIDCIVCTPDCVELFNPKVVQATMGSVFRMGVAMLTEDQIRQDLEANEFYVIAADLQGTHIYTFDFNQKVAIVIGSESHGVRPAMRSLVNEFVTIPGKGPAESLNASVAAAVFMSQWSAAQSAPKL